MQACSQKDVEKMHWLPPLLYSLLTTLLILLHPGSQKDNIRIILLVRLSCKRE